MTVDQLLYKEFLSIYFRELEPIIATDVAKHLRITMFELKEFINRNLVYVEVLTDDNSLYLQPTRTSLLLYISVMHEDVKGTR